MPEYLVSETGPDHEKTFTAAARVGGVSYGTGTGRSKKEAEQQAAESAWRAIRAAADERAKTAAEAPVVVEADGGSPTPASRRIGGLTPPSFEPPPSALRCRAGAQPFPAGRGPPTTGVRDNSRWADGYSAPMPELPEVEVVRRGLERWVAGRIVADVEVLHPRAVRRHLMRRRGLRGAAQRPPDRHRAAAR